MKDRLRVAIVGVSGYGGGELFRLLSSHPNVRIAHIAAETRANESLAAIFPHLPDWGTVEKFPEDRPWEDVDVIFTALPAGQSGRIAKAYRDTPVRIIDLGPDFRFSSRERFQEWYKMDHPFPEGLSRSAYALVEWNRDAIRKSGILACPGCYPTGALLGILPFSKNGLLGEGPIVVDGKSGVTGAGRGLTLETHFSEISEAIRPYKPLEHRHVPEMEQGIEQLSGVHATVIFVPHLVPINRGLLSTIYLRLSKPLTAGEAQEVLRDAYRQDPHIVFPGVPPHTGGVRGTNRTAIHAECREDMVVVMTAIDNLVKGAAGQAIQAMNVMLGFPEETGLPKIGIFP